MTVTDCFFAVIAAINKLFLHYLCLSEDDDFQTDSYTDRKSPLGFFSKFWELQVGMVSSQRIIFYNMCSLFNEYFIKLYQLIINSHIIA